MPFGHCIKKEKLRLYLGFPEKHSRLGRVHIMHMLSVALAAIAHQAADHVLQGWTALHIAAAQGNMAALSTLLKSKLFAVGNKDDKVRP